MRPAAVTPEFPYIWGMRWFPTLLLISLLWMCFSACQRKAAPAAASVPVSQPAEATAEAQVAATLLEALPNPEGTELSEACREHPCFGSIRIDTVLRAGMDATLHAGLEITAYFPYSMDPVESTTFAGRLHALPGLTAGQRFRATLSEPFEQADGSRLYTVTGYARTNE
ncbi:MAG: hypothetical protein AAGB22_12055 [Bacteroidota bacterium]